MARVGGALADVPLTAMAEYRKSQSLEYAASHAVTSTGKLIKTAVVEAADLAKYMASAAQVGLEWMDGQYVETSGGAAPPVRATWNGEASDAGGGMPQQQRQTWSGGGVDGARETAPFVAGLREAGAAVQHGLSEATDAVVTAPLKAAETWGTDGAALPPVVTTIIRGVPVAILRPMIGATEAVSAISTGVRNSIAD